MTKKFIKVVRTPPHATWSVTRSLMLDFHSMTLSWVPSTGKFIYSIISLFTNHSLLLTSRQSLSYQMRYGRPPMPHQHASLALNTGRMFLVGMDFFPPFFLYYAVVHTTAVARATATVFLSLSLFCLFHTDSLLLQEETRLHRQRQGHGQGCASDTRGKTASAAGRARGAMPLGSLCVYAFCFLICLAPNLR